MGRQVFLRRSRRHDCSAVLDGLVGNDVLHSWFYMPVVYAIYCAAAGLSLLFMRKTRNMSIEDLDVKPTPVYDLRAEKAIP